MKEEPKAKTIVEELIADVEAYIDDWFHPNPAFGLLRGVRWRPSTDAYETDRAYHITMAIPGMKTEEIGVQLEPGVVCVQGVRREPCCEKRHYFKMEIPVGSFERRIRVPASIRPEDISVSYADGLLHIRLPKKAPVEVPIESR
ncbi:MAG: Hsp20/alpha crystallin family protein [Gemmatimonadota bacterium]